MQRNEMIKILEIINNAFPYYFRDKDSAQKNKIVDLWLESFKDDDFELVKEKVNMWCNTQKYAPRICEIKQVPNAKKFDNYSEVLTEYDKQVIMKNFKKYASMFLDDYKGNQEKVDDVYKRFFNKE